MRSDDIKISLDLLDRVINEFDDGMISSTESESPINNIRHNSYRPSYNDDDKESHIEAEIRRQPPPKARKSGQPSVELPNRRATLSHQIDDIFSEVNDEMYPSFAPSPGPARRPPSVVAPKVDTTSEWVAKHRQRSPVRKMTDPLPSPPVLDLKKNGPSSGAIPKVKDEVVVYNTDRQGSGAEELVSLKKSVNVKAQIHSLEAKSRNVKTGAAKVAKPSRSKSEAPPLTRAGRLSPTQPPPMPEKVKIHLKNNQSLEREPLKATSGVEKMKKSAYGARFDKSKKSTQNASVSHISNKVTKPGPDFGKPAPEVKKPLRDSVKPKPDVSGGESHQVKRSRSVGPVVEAAQRELSHLDLKKVLSGVPEVNGGSAGKASKTSTGSSRKLEHVSRNESPIVPNERRSRSRGRTENNSFSSNPRSKASQDGSRSKSDLHRRALGARSPTVPSDYPPRHLPGKMPARQKSMIDLRDPHWDPQPRHRVHPLQMGRIPGNSSAQQPKRPTPGLVRSATEHDIRVRSRKNGPISPPPFHELPPHIRQHMVRQHGYRLGEATSESMFALDQASLGKSKKRDDPYMARQLEARREALIRGGFSTSHPYISGEISVHPELQGQLPFKVPSRTIPLRPEDYRRFKPELWVQDHHPNPVSFADLAVLQSELELRRKREIYRQSSQRRTGLSEMDSSNFTSLPWDEIIPKRQMEQFQHQLQQYLLEQQQQVHLQQDQHRSKSHDSKKKLRPFSLFGGSAWFNPTQVLRESESPESSESRVKKQGHWLLKERSPSDQILQSMPPHIGTLKDSGIEESEIFVRSSEKRSSFGMALKDKFQRNPNMYFPPDGHPGVPRTSSSGSEKRLTSSTSKSTSLDDLSDTDTLIHNMSDGSYEKDRASLGSSGGHNSLGSASGKGSRSSGNSSLSPHNSMEGSPRIISRQGAKFQPTSSLGAKSNSSTSNGVSFNKKTIRNYTPQASSNMLREFEDRRNNSMDWRKGLKDKRASSQPPEAQTVPEKTSLQALKTSKSHEERRFDLSDVNATHATSTPAENDKSSMDKLIEDFHRNLPPPPVESRQQKPGRDSTLEKTLTTTTASSKRTSSKHGTLNSEISNWSAASSVASFDYQPARYGTESHSLLPALTEVEYVTNGGKGETPTTSRSRTHTPKGERVPPEGASADSPHSFVQRIEIGPESRAEKSKVPTNETVISDRENDDTDEFSNLRKLISEGRISGLSDRPPNFVPPTPPNAKKVGVSATKKESNIEKKPSRTSADRPRKSREAPKPPTNQTPLAKTATNQSLPLKSGSSEVKLLTSRHRESFEDLTHMETRRARTGNTELKRSSSNHGARPSGFDTVNAFEETTAQLIADSTEKKFKLNPFKGMWKKKHYSFDFN